MEFFAPYLEIVTTVLYLCSVVILVWGVVVAVKGFFASQFMKMEGRERFSMLTRVKNNLGGYVLLSLEILIVADIIESIAKPTLEDIVRLAAIVAIRTVISYFLNKEIRQPESNVEKGEIQ